MNYKTLKIFSSKWWNEEGTDEVKMKNRFHNEIEANIKSSKQSKICHEFLSRNTRYKVTTMTSTILRQFLKTLHFTSNFRYAIKLTQTKITTSKRSCLRNLFSTIRSQIFFLGTRKKYLLTKINGWKSPKPLFIF